MKKIFLFLLHMTLFVMIVACQSDDPNVWQEEILDRVAEIDAEEQMVLNNHTAYHEYLNGEVSGSTSFIDKSYYIQKDPYYLYVVHGDGSHHNDEVYVENGNTYDYVILEPSTQDETKIYANYFFNYVYEKDLPLIYLTELESILNVSEITRGEHNDYELLLTAEDAIAADESFFNALTQELYAHVGMNSENKEWYVEINFQLIDGGYKTVTTFGVTYGERASEFVIEHEHLKATFDCLDFSKDPYILVNNRDFDYAIDIDLDENIEIPVYMFDACYKVYLERGQYVFKTQQTISVIGPSLTAVYAVDDNGPNFYSEHIFYSKSDESMLFKGMFYIEEDGYYYLVAQGDPGDIFYLHKTDYETIPQDDVVTIEEKTYNGVIEGYYDLLMYMNDTEETVVVTVSTESPVNFYTPDHNFYAHQTVDGSYTFDLASQEVFYINVDGDEEASVSFTIINIEIKA